MTQPDLCSFENLWRQYRGCRRNKRNAASERLVAFLRRITVNGRRPGWGLKLGIASSFPSIHKQTLCDTTIADYGLYPYTRAANESGFDLGDFPALGCWLRGVEAQPGFIAMLVDGADETLSFADYFHTTV